MPHPCIIMHLTVWLQFFLLKPHSCEWYPVIPNTMRRLFKFVTDESSIGGAVKKIFEL